MTLRPRLKLVVNYALNWKGYIEKLFTADNSSSYYMAVRTWDLAQFVEGFSKSSNKSFAVTDN